MGHCVSNCWVLLGRCVFSTIKFGILNRKDPFKWAMRMIPFYYTFMATVLTLFMIAKIPSADGFLEESGVGRTLGIVCGVFFGILGFSYLFFIPYFHRKLVFEDIRIGSW
ncbi:hypothetical protein BKA65DRAFT_157237 [Rhexocercosporidium sp. MPI-PUGE-AT-0058]|nr:hypothetical protein BKA65DRAFT_157237 [Rhexocercosporidium sp. MPI-PUGE-AT-0058]